MALGRKRSGGAGETLLHEEFVLADRPGRKRDKLRIRATDQALHVRGTGLDWRLGYEAAYVTSVRGAPSETDRLELVAHDGTTLDVAFPTHDHGLGAIIESRLVGFDQLAVDGEVQGRRVTLTYHPWRTDVMSYWEFEGLPERLGPSARQELGQLRDLARRRLLDLYPPAEVPASRRGTAAEFQGGDWITQDWAEPMTAVARHKGIPKPSLSIAGHSVEQNWETPVIVGVTETHVYLAAFETMRLPMQVRRAPELVAYPFRNFADWELCPQPGGMVLVRLLELEDRILGLASLEEALHVAGGFGVRLVGLSNPARADAVAQTIVEAIKRRGAYSPGTRTSHPLHVSDAH